MPFRIALSGLNAASTDLQVTGNNIANAATNGFKESRTEFSDLYASAIQDTGSSPGQGVRAANVAQQFSQGSIDFTSNNLDLAISGQGFFVLEGTDGSQAYTRAGAYSVDREGYVVNSARDRLQIYEGITGAAGTTSFNTGALSDLRLPTAPSAPNASTEVAVAVNLDSSQPAPDPTIPFDPTIPSTYGDDNTRSITIYDSLGNAHTQAMYFRKIGPNTWEQYTYIDSNPVGAPNAMTFDSSGNLTSPPTVPTAPYDPGNGAAPINVTLDFAGTTQRGIPFDTYNLSQDGYTSGRLAGVDIDTDGVIFARFTNGQSSALGKVALAKFNNQQGLRQIGNSNWAESFESGVAQLGQASASSFGQIQSGALESSNVDIAAQLVNLITAQRSFQANAEVISTADSVTQTVINIR